MRYARVLTAGLVAVVCTAAGVATLAVVGASGTDSSSGGSASGPPELLPDLDQVAPRGLWVKTVYRGRSRRFRVGFYSAIENRGVGPLVVTGRLRNLGFPRVMDADQVIQRTDGSTVTKRGVGLLRFVRSPDHRHWHFLRVERYELRRASDNKLVRPDRKSGFCLGDRYAYRPKPQEAPPRAIYTGNCNRDPFASRVREGISVGYGDDYKAHLEGQYLDLTGVRAGRYFIAHRVNVDRTLRESDYTNNASSVLIRLRWPWGMRSKPAIAVLARCPDTRRCA